MFKVKKPLIIFVILTLTIMPFASTALAQEYFEAEDPSGGAMIFDFGVVRPMGIIATAIGSAPKVNPPTALTFLSLMASNIKLPDRNIPRGCKVVGLQLI